MKIKTLVVLSQLIIPAASEGEVHQWAGRFHARVLYYQPPEGDEIFPTVLIEWPTLWAAIEAGSQYHPVKP